MGEDALLSEVGRLFIETLPPKPQRLAGRNPARLDIGAGWGLAPGRVLGSGLALPRQVGVIPGRADAAETRWVIASLRGLTEYLSAHRGA